MDISRVTHLYPTRAQIISKMVKVGDFSLQLVDANTKEPFKEHVAPSDGQSYAGKLIHIVVVQQSMMALSIHIFAYISFMTYLSHC